MHKNGISKEKGNITHLFHRVLLMESSGATFQDSLFPIFVEDRKIKLLENFISVLTPMCFLRLGDLILCVEYGFTRGSLQLAGSLSERIDIIPRFNKSNQVIFEWFPALSPGNSDLTIGEWEADGEVDVSKSSTNVSGNRSCSQRNGLDC